MFYRPPIREVGFEASDDDWAEFAVALYEAAVKRGETPEDDTAPEPSGPGS